jgi:hypothetical protein
VLKAETAAAKTLQARARGQLAKHEAARRRKDHTLHRFGSDGQDGDVSSPEPGSPGSGHGDHSRPRGGSSAISSGSSSEQSQLTLRLEQRASAKKRAASLVKAKAKAELAAELEALGGVWPLAAFDAATGLPLPLHLRGPLVPTPSAAKQLPRAQLLAAAHAADALLQALDKPPPPPDVGVLWFVPDALALWRSGPHQKLDARLADAHAASKYLRLKASLRAAALRGQQQRLQEQAKAMAMGRVALDHTSGLLRSSSDAGNAMVSTLTPLFDLPKRKETWSEYMARRPKRDERASKGGGSGESGAATSLDSRSGSIKMYFTAGLGTAI